MTSRSHHVPAGFQLMPAASSSAPINDNAADERLSEEQLAERTGTELVLWEQLRTSGDGPPCLRLGDVVLYRWSLVEKWLSARARIDTFGSANVPAR